MNPLDLIVEVPAQDKDNPNMKWGVFVPTDEWIDRYINIHTGWASTLLFLLADSDRLTLQQVIDIAPTYPSLHYENLLSKVDQLHKMGALDVSDGRIKLRRRPPGALEELARI